jgi:hypothetical protein
MAISGENIERFLMAKRPSGYVCSFCGNPKFLMNGGRPVPGLNPEPVELALPYTDPRPNVESGEHHFYSIVCSNCGRADFFHLNQINAWLNENPKPNT